MVQDYEPHLFGTTHLAENLGNVIKELEPLNLSKVGIEVPHIALFGRYSNFSGPSERFFWTGLIDYLKKRNVQVVFLTTDKLFEEIIKEGSKMSKEGRRPISAHSGTLTDRYQQLIHNSMVKEMEQRAGSEKPEAIIVGNLHGAVMRKDMKIPKQKFHVITTKNRAELLGYMQQEIRAVRRYQRARKSKLAPQPKTRNKRRRK